MEEKGIGKISETFVEIIVNGTEKFVPSGLAELYSVWRMSADIGALPSAGELENFVVNTFIAKDELCRIRGIGGVIARLAADKECKAKFEARFSDIKYNDAVCVMSEIASTIIPCPDDLPDVAMNVTIVRHGEDEQDKIGGWSDNRLTDNGVAQVNALAEAIAASGEKFDAMISSDLRRARETAEIIAAKLDCEIVFDEGLRETNNGDYKNLTKAEFAARNCRYYTTLGMDEKYPNGESPNEFYARVRDAFISIIKKYDGKRVMLVTHGGVIAVIRCLAYGYRYTNARKFVPKHATMIRIRS